METPSKRVRVGIGRSDENRNISDGQGKRRRHSIAGVGTICSLHTATERSMYLKSMQYGVREPSHAVRYIREVAALERNGLGKPRYKLELLF